MNIKKVMSNTVWYSVVIVVGCCLAHITPPTQANVTSSALSSEFVQGELMPRTTTAEHDIAEITAKVQMHK